MNKLKSIFKTKRPLIGMIHFPPLIGYPDYPGFSYIVKKMLKEAEILENAGFDGIMIENNYDVPHTEKIPPISAAMLGSLAAILQNNIKIPFGINVLWNDFETALSICASTSAKFFRVPAFVDTVKTSYGIMPARAKEVVQLRDKVGLNNIAIFVDIQVKHSKMVDKDKPLEKSAKQAVDAGADGVIVTGKWTGDAPDLSDLKVVRESIGDFPILIGSGAILENFTSLSRYADGVIVGTALKKGKIHPKTKEVNLKPFTKELSLQKAKNFREKYKKVFKVRKN